MPAVDPLKLPLYRPSQCGGKLVDQRSQHQPVTKQQASGLTMLDFFALRAETGRSCTSREQVAAEVRVHT